MRQDLMTFASCHPTSQVGFGMCGICVGLGRYFLFDFFSFLLSCVFKFTGQLCEKSVF